MGLVSSCMCPTVQWWLGFGSRTAALVEISRLSPLGELFHASWDDSPDSPAYQIPQRKNWIHKTHSGRFLGLWLHAGRTFWQWYKCILRSEEHSLTCSSEYFLSQWLLCCVLPSLAMTWYGPHHMFNAAKARQTTWTAVYNNKNSISKQLTPYMVSLDHIKAQQSMCDKRLKGY